MIPIEIINAMRRAGALQVNSFDESGDLHFIINFKIVEKEFPRFMDIMVRDSLGAFDLDLYNQGLIAYLVQDDGQLGWKPTRKLQQILTGML